MRTGATEYYFDDPMEKQRFGDFIRTIPGYFSGDVIEPHEAGTYQMPIAFDGDRQGEYFGKGDNGSGHYEVEGVRVEPNSRLDQVVEVFQVIEGMRS